MQEKPSPQRRYFLAGCATILLGGFIAYGTYLWWRPGWTVPRITQHIQAEVQLGWDRATSEAWLDRHGIHHDWFEHTDLGYRRGNYTMPQLAGLDASNLSGMVVARLESPDSFYFHVFFFFDKQGRLVGHFVDSELYGW